MLGQIESLYDPLTGKSQSNKKGVMKTSITSYDLNSQGSIQCVAIAKTEEEKDALLKRAYYVLFSPEKDEINCWILCREKSEIPN